MMKHDIKQVCGDICIDGNIIETKQEGFVSCNILSCTVGTNGYCGGDSGHGSRTYLKIEDGAATDIECRVTKNEYSGDTIEIVLGGDTELYTFIEALEFAVTSLKIQSKEPYEDIIDEGITKLSYLYTKLKNEYDKDDCLKLIQQIKIVSSALTCKLCENKDIFKV